MSIPNIISLARLVAVPFMVYFMLESLYGWAFWLFLCAGASDAADGLIAKRMGLESRLGAYLDPLADKALLVGTYLTLGYQGKIPTLIVILVVFRDILIVGGVLLLAVFRQIDGVHPAHVSKVNTAAQILLAAVVLAELGLGVDVGWTVEAAVYLVGVTTVVSGGWYLVRWGRRMTRMEDSR